MWFVHEWASIAAIKCWVVGYILEHTSQNTNTTTPEDSITPSAPPSPLTVTHPYTAGTHTHTRAHTRAHTHTHTQQARTHTHTHTHTHTLLPFVVSVTLYIHTFSHAMYCMYATCMHWKYT